VARGSRRVASAYDPASPLRELLAFHLYYWGTRPEGSPENQGDPWAIKLFASKIQVEPHTVHNWLNGETLPKEITFPRILTTLFGGNPQFDQWREDLTRAYRRPADTQIESFDLPDRLASFIGRSEQLQSIEAALSQGAEATVTHASKRVVIEGLGGIGKTALAAEYAHRRRNSYAGICWCAAESREQLSSSLAALAVALKISAVGMDTEKAAKAALQYFAKRSDVWLLIYDNVTSPKYIADMLPKGGAHLIVTSRYPNWTTWENVLFLDVLPQADAERLLHRRAQRHRDVGAAALLTALGRLPLALDHAAAYCHITGMTFSDCAAAVKTIIDELPDDVPYSRSVFATFTLAIEAAAKNCADAELLMIYLSYCSPERIPMSLVDGAIESDSQRRVAIAALASVALLRHVAFDNGTSAVIVHRVVQVVAQVRAEARNLSDWASSLLIERLATIYPDPTDDPKTWPVCAQLSPHLVALARGRFPASRDVQKWTALLDRGSSYFLELGSFSQAFPLADLARGERNAALGLEHVDTAISYRNVGRIFLSWGKLDEARSYLRIALTILQTVVGPNHPHTARAMTDYGELLLRSGDLAGAGYFYISALKIFEETFGLNHLDTSLALNNYANIMMDEGKFADAELFLKQALAVRVQQLGLEHQETARTILCIGRLLANQGNPAAKEFFEKALGIFENTVGPQHHVTATCLNELGLFAMQSERNLGKAEIFHKRALAIRLKALGPYHEDTANSLNNVGVTLKLQRKVEESRPYFEWALHIYDTIRGPDDADRAWALLELGRVYWDQLDLSRAQPLLEAAVAGFEAAMGHDHPETNRARWTTAGLLLSLDKVSEALALAQTALAAHETRLGKIHHYTIDSAGIVWLALTRLGRAAEAEDVRIKFGFTVEMREAKAYISMPALTLPNRSE
jgi:tetratricopeptide (TPR) repeat protein